MKRLWLGVQARNPRSNSSHWNHLTVTVVRQGEFPANRWILVGSYSSSGMPLQVTSGDSFRRKSLATSGEPTSYTHAHESVGAMGVPWRPQPAREVRTTRWKRPLAAHHCLLATRTVTGRCSRIGSRPRSFGGATTSQCGNQHDEKHRDGIANVAGHFYLHVIRNHETRSAGDVSQRHACAT